MKAFVTGGGGFLGQYIVEQLLQHGDGVTTFSRGDYPDLAAKGVRVIRGDICDRQAVIQASQGMDIIYHVAAKAGLWGDYDDFYAVNVTGTDNIIAACRQNHIPKLVYTSSPSVIFDGSDQQGIDESTPYPAHYESPYPATKALAEQRVTTANSSTLATVSLRPHLIFGPRDNHLLPGLLARAREGKVPQVGDGTNLVDLTYAEDAARAHLLAASMLKPGSSVAGKVYFISQDSPVILWEWIADLLEQLAYPPVKTKLPLWLARNIGALLSRIHKTLGLKAEPRITPFLASELAQNHYYDISAAKADLGYQPIYTIEEATARTVRWLKAQQPQLSQPEPAAMTNDTLAEDIPESQRSQQDAP